MRDDTLEYLDAQQQQADDYRSLEQRITHLLREKFHGGQLKRDEVIDLCIAVGIDYDDVLGDARVYSRDLWDDGINPRPF